MKNENLDPNFKIQSKIICNICLNCKKEECTGTCDLFRNTEKSGISKKGKKYYIDIQHNGRRYYSIFTTRNQKEASIVYKVIKQQLNIGKTIEEIFKML